MPFCRRDKEVAVRQGKGCIWLLVLLASAPRRRRLDFVRPAGRTIKDALMLRAEGDPRTASKTWRPLGARTASGPTTRDPELRWCVVEIIE